MDIRSLLTARDVALDAGLRQRPPILTPEDALDQIAAAMRRMVGDPSDLDPDFAQPPGAGSDDMPGLGGAGIIDGGVDRFPPGFDPLQVRPGSMINQPLKLPGRFDRPVPSWVPAVGRPDVYRRSDQPAGSVEVPEATHRATPAALRLAASPAGTAVSSRRPSAPGFLPASQPPGAGSLSVDRSAGDASSAAADASPPTSGDQVPDAQGAVTVQPTASLVDKLVAAAAERAASIAAAAAEASIDRLRQEIFAGQTARNSLFSH